MGTSLILTPSSLHNVPIPDLDTQTKVELADIVRKLNNVETNPDKKADIDTLLFNALDLSDSERQAILEHIQKVSSNSSKKYWEQSLR
jgi:hypothetical protein